MPSDPLDHRIEKTKKNSTLPHLDFIDGLRGLAILMVLVNHWCFVGLGNPQITSPWLYQFFYAGNTGVLLFFMLSAYTLYRSWDIRSRVESSPISSFYVRRFFRIFPLWWICILLYAYLKKIPLVLLWSHFLMLFGFFLKTPAIFGGEWTLFVEESFYLLMPWTVGFLKSPTRALVWLGGLYGVRLVWLGLGGYIDGSVGEPSFYVALFPLAHWYVFGLGMLLYRCQQKWDWQATLERSLFAGVGLEILTWVLVVQWLGAAPWSVGDQWSSVALWFVFVTSTSKRTLLGKLVRQSWLREFGICCYSIYLFHIWILAYFNQTLGQWILNALGPSRIEVVFICTFPLFALTSLVVGKLLFYGLERPFMGLGKKIIEQKRGVRA